MRKYLFILAIISSSYAFAQKADQLTEQLKGVKEDTTYLKILDMLSYEFIITNSNFETGEKYVKKAYDLSEKMIKQSHNAQNVSIINSCKNSVANIHMTIGLYYHIHANYGEAITNYLAAQKLYQETGNKRGIAVSYNHTGNIYYAEKKLDEAMKCHLTALKIRTEIGDKEGVEHSLNNIGIVYEMQGKYEDALKSDLDGLAIAKEINDQRSIGASYLDMGIVCKDMGKYDEALKNYMEALKIFVAINKVFDIADTYCNIGEVGCLTGNYSDAISWLNKGLKLSLENNTKSTTKDIYFNLWKVYKKLNDYPDALKYYQLFVDVKNTLFEGESLEKIAALKHRYESEKKEEADRLEQERKDAISQAALNRERGMLYGYSGGFLVVLAFSMIVFYQKNKIKTEKKRSEDLLLNILPVQIANELKENGKSKARNYESVTVMFTDFKNFTKISEALSPSKLVEEIDHCFSAFDRIIKHNGIEKIKTIGDAYMCAGGLPVVNKTHAKDTVKAALEIRDFMMNHNKEKLAKGELPFEIRIGINTGPVVAGIVGVKKFAYDIWGDTVNLASLMESSGEAGKVNISINTYELVKDKFTGSHRGKIMTKNLGEVDMYFVS